MAPSIPPPRVLPKPVRKAVDKTVLSVVNALVYLVDGGQRQQMGNAAKELVLKHDKLELWRIKPVEAERVELGHAEVEVDLAPIAEGQEITIKWRGNPVFVRHRLPAEIEAAKAVAIADLPDPLARNANLPDSDQATDVNRVVGGKEQFLIMMGVCTHLGCVPLPNEGDYAVVEGNGKHGGWFCPCHGSHYDTAGRIRKGPAPQNLAVPQYAYLSDSKIRIG